MQFDRTDLAIRQRTLAELLDLSLMVFRHYGLRIAAYSLTLTIPIMLLNYALIGWMVSPGNFIEAEMMEITPTESRWRFAWLLIVASIIQAPLANLLVSYYLGQATFGHRPKLGETIKNVAKLFWRIAWVLGIVRMGLIAWLVLLVTYGSPRMEPFLEIFILGICVGGISIAIRSARPFAPEILVLERCPLRSRESNVLSYRRRSSSLHAPMQGELIPRFIAVSAVSAVIFTCLILNAMFIAGVMAFQWQWNWYMDFIGLPICLWVVGMWSTVFRFLSYLDTRIRLEGWEVELLLKAEAERWKSKHQVGVA